MALTAYAIASPLSLAQVSPLTAVTAPSNPTLSASGSGSTLPAATYYVKITYVYSITYNGRTWSQETTASGEVSQATTSGQNLVVTSPSWPTGVTAANVYVSSSTGTEKYQGQITTSGGTLTISAPLQTVVNSPATTSSPNGNNAPPTSMPSGQIIYQAPASSGNVTSPSSTAYITEIVIANTLASAATITLGIGGVAAANQIIPAVSVAANDSKIISGIKTMMPAGSTLQALQGTSGAITLTISGVEVQ